jgi:hypothetical protein
VRLATNRLRRVAPLALVLVLAAACGDNNKSTATTAKSPTTITPSGKPKPGLTVPAATGGKGKNRKATLVAGKRNLFPFLKGSIKRYAPTQVEGKNLKVVARAGSDAFWAGRSRTERILVKMRLKGGSAPKIAVGKKVDFIGLLTGSIADASAGVTVSTDKALLAAQGAYVDASSADVKLH